MKTTTEYQLKEKKRKLYVPSIKKLNINLYDEMSEKVKVKLSELHSTFASIYTVPHCGVVPDVYEMSVFSSCISVWM